MEIHGISIEEIKSLTEEEWISLDAATKEEYELILSYECCLPPNFVDEKQPSGMWLSDVIVEYTFT